MEIRPKPNTPSLQLVLASLPATARAWSAGQLIDALVTRVDPARGTVLLQLPEGEVEARSEIPLQPGTRLQLTAEAGDGTRILLRVRNDTAAETRLTALRQALPRELPLVPLFEAIEELLQSPQQPLPDPVRRQAQALMQARPTAERLITPEGLRSALRDSGVVLESRLAHPASPCPTADLKARLFALLATLIPAPKSAPAPAAPSRDPAPAVAPQAQPAPTAPSPRIIVGKESAPIAADPPPSLPPATDELLTTLARHTEGALARIQLHQLQALPDAQPAPQWIFELPVRTPQGNEPLLLRFEREQGHENGTDHGAPGWRVSLDLSSAEHGALRAVVGWRGGEISARFFAEREATALNLRAHLQHLGRRLTAAGIRLGAVEAHTGIPATPPRSAAPLLSEHA